MFDNQSQLWNISVISRLHRNIDLVRSNVTGQLMVRRLSSAGDYPVLRALCGIKHKNLMEVYDVILRDGICVSLCEFVNGSTLDFFAGRQPYDIKSAKDIMCQICDGLTVLHSRGIVHRDIKPENIMLDNSGAVKIIDYSIARVIKPNRSKDTEVLGTAGYASPEQFGFGQTDARADIYACGVLLNYLLTGCLPDERLHDGLLRTVIERCIEIDGSKRFQSADDLKKILQGRRINTRRTFRAPPGFRSKNPAAIFFTILLYLIWGFMLLLYINGFDMLMTSSWKHNMQQIILCADLLLFWTALPYVLFGDMFRLSERINPDNPKNGKYVLRILGTASIILGIVLLFGSIYISQKL